MSKVDLSVIGSKTEPIDFEYTWRDVALYNIGVGADENDLEFVYEDVPGGIKVLPSFCVVPAIRAFPYLGDDLEWSLMLHGEQVIRLSQPLAPQGKIIQVGEVLNIYDKGKGAVYRIRIQGRTEEDKELYEAEWSIFYLGAGGFGGDPGPKAERIVPPEGIEPAKLSPPYFPDREISRAYSTPRPLISPGCGGDVCESCNFLYDAELCTGYQTHAQGVAEERAHGCTHWSDDPHGLQMHGVQMHEVEQ